MNTIRKLYLVFILIYSGSINALQIGDKAPNFVAQSTKGEINFHEWIGNKWTILFSHPGDFTPICTTELAELAFLQPEFKKRQTKIITLSADSLDDHLEWVTHIDKYKNLIRYLEFLVCLHYLYLIFYDSVWQLVYACRFFLKNLKDYLYNIV
jgi:hypothetical protein